jgi:hypothetical protein
MAHLVGKDQRGFLKRIGGRTKYGRGQTKCKSGTGSKVDWVAPILMGKSSRDDRMIQPRRDL